MGFTAFVALLSIYVVVEGSLEACSPRDYGQGSVVCVCNSTYCDKFPPLQLLPIGEYVVYSSSKDGLRYESSTGKFSQLTNRGSELEDAMYFKIDRSVVYQEVTGFGGAMTDAAGINIASLSDEAQEQLLRSYFSEDGIEYNMVRIPIGGSDFSTRPYTYDDDGEPEDLNLTHFHLADEDIRYKIPYMKKAINMSPKDILVIGSAWSAPKWMKTNNDIIGEGKLKKEYYQLWADYHLKFLDQYGGEGLKFWGLTTQNEPIDGLIPNFSFNCMGWTADDQRIWVGENLGPTLHANGYDDLEIMVLDDQRISLPTWPNEMFADEKVSKYANGIAVHWYVDFLVGPQNLNKTHYLHPDKFLIYTEACNGDKTNEHNVLLGSWERGEKYAYSIIETMTNWVVGWVDWNLALDLTGGPNWSKNFVDAAVIVNASADEFYKQPTYYALGHFSKFVPKGSERIGLFKEMNGKLLNTEDDEQSRSPSTVDAIAFTTDQKTTVVVLLNRLEEDKTVVIHDPDLGELTKAVPAKSIHTFVYSY